MHHLLRRSGFTLMELLIVLGIIGILAAIVLAAINPTKQLTDAHNASRDNGTVQIENAVNQYLVDGESLTNVPEGKPNAKDICRPALTETGCTLAPVNGMDLSVLTPTYIVDIPVDPAETSETVTGYRIYRVNTLYRTCAVRAEAGCGS